MERKRNYSYIEYLRVLSAFAVIVIHVSGANWFRIPIASTDWIVQTFYNLAGRFSVCVFCMISGALLLRSDKEVSAHEILTRYIRRILVCLVVWVVLYAALYTLMNQGDAKYFVKRLFQLPDHLWYLLMLIGLYLVYPVLKRIAADRLLTRYLIWILIGFGLLDTITRATGFFEEMAGESYGFSLWDALLGNLGQLKVAFIPGYLAFFLMGHYIHEYGLGKWHKRIVYAAVPALILSAVLTILMSVWTDKGVYVFMMETNPLLVLASAGIFAFFRGRDDNVHPHDKHPQLTKTVVWLGANTFGIYLIHFAVRDCLAQYLSFDVASYPAILSVPFNSLLIFVISLALTVLMKKIPGLKKVVS
jgi:surface polysaccharide O-acyltransferase-like enzyme